MKVLSIQQPYAWLIVNGYKDVENRTWGTPYRGKIAIHASNKFDWDFFFGDPEDPTFYTEELVRKHFGIKECVKKVTKKAQDFGAIIGTVEISDVVNTDKNSCMDASPWCFDAGFAWFLKNPVAWDNPVTGIKGKLNIWNWTGEVPE